MKETSTLRWRVGLFRRSSIRRFLASVKADAPHWGCLVTWTEAFTFFRSTFTVSLTGAPRDVSRLLARIDAYVNG